MTKIVKVLVDNQKALDDLKDRLTTTSGAIQFDLETNSADRFAPDTVGAQFGVVKDGVLYAHYIPTWHRRCIGFRFVRETGQLEGVFEEIPTFLKEKDILDITDLFRNDKERTVCGANIKYDLKVMSHAGLRHRGERYYFKNKILDTMLGSQLLEKAVGNGLKQNVEMELGVTMTHFEEICPNFDRSPEVPIEVIAKYGYDDVIYPIQLASKFMKEMKQDRNPKMLKLWTDLEGEIVKVLVHMETSGVTLDLDTLKDLQSRLLAEAAEIEQKVKDLIGNQEINISSDAQLSHYMFDETNQWDANKMLRLANKYKEVFARGKPTKTYDKGTYGISGDILNDVIFYKAGTKTGLEVADLLSEFRSIHVLAGTTIKGLLQYVQPDGKIYPNYNQDGTVSSRLSCKNPNLMGIPTRTVRGKEIRKAFRPSPGKILIGADYSALEMVLTGDRTGDPLLLDIFCANPPKDPHQALADAIGQPRPVGKTLNYQVGYGGGPAAIARSLRCTLEQARVYHRGYYEGYANVGPYKEAIKAHVRKHGYIENVFGRRRSFHDEIAKGYFWDNEACNFPIQSFAGDLMKIAMRNIYNYLEEHNLLGRVNMLLQIHDELLFECDIEIVDEVRAMIKEKMEGVAKLKAPLRVDDKVGMSWYDCH